MKKVWIVLAVLGWWNVSAAQTGNSYTEAERNNILDKAAKLKLPWIKNNGVKDNPVDWYTTMENGNIYLAKTGELVYETVNEGSINGAGKPDITRHVPESPVAKTIEGYVWKESFVNGKHHTVVPELTAQPVVSYYIGNDPAKWESGKATYYTLNLGKVWNNVEVKLNRYGNSIEKRFYIHPQGKVSDVVMQVNGSNRLRIAEDGALVANGQAKGEEMRFSKPVAYQYINGAKVPVPVSYLLQGKTYGFSVGNYNAAYTLIIDPIFSALSASTYIGGTGHDYNNCVTTDATGCIYITSGTLATNFPTTTGAYRTTSQGGQDSYVVKLSSDLSALLAGTYIGGATSSDQSMFVNVATNGDVYMTGQTFSSDFPTTSGAYQTSLGGGSFDNFISRFNNSMTTLLSSTYLGGGGSDLTYSIQFATTGDIYCAGFTTSPNFPVTSGAYQTTLNGSGDNFVIKMDAGLTTVKAGTLVGGSDYDYAYTIALDGSDNSYISGQTVSTDYPTTSGAYQTTRKGVSDTYVTILNSSLTSLIASTYFGGNDGEQTNKLVVDGSGNCYFTGWVRSGDMPVTPGAFQSTLSGSTDAYMASLNSSLTTLLAATYLGGNDEDYGYGLALDDKGGIFVSGFTGGYSSSSTYPVTSGAFQSTYGGGYYDAFISQVSTSGTTLMESTFIGGSNSDFGYYLGLSPAGNVCVAGQTQSTNYPVTTGVYQGYNRGAADVFVTKFGNVPDVVRPKANFVADEVAICKGGTVHYMDQSTNSPDTWQWKFDGGSPATSGAQNPTVTYSNIGRYSVKLVIKNENGTDSLVRDAYISVNAAPVAGTVATLPDSVCAGSQSLLLAAGNEAPVQWQYSLNNTSYTDMPGADTVLYAVTGQQTAWFRVVVSGECGIDSSAPARLVVNQLPEPVVTAADNIVCSGDSTQMCVNETYASYQWNTADMGGCIGAKQAGGYWVSVTDANGCSAVSPRKQLAVYPAPSVSVIIKNDTLTSFGAEAYQWYYNGEAINGATQPTHIAQQSGQYAVQITDANGCKSMSNQFVVSVTGINELADGMLHVYPNPATGYVYLQNRAAMGIEKLEVYDVLGRMVYEERPVAPVTSSMRVELETLLPGTYYLQVLSDGQKYSFKLLKQ